MLTHELGALGHEPALSDGALRSSVIEWEAWCSFKGYPQINTYCALSWEGCADLKRGRYGWVKVLTLLCTEFQTILISTLLLLWPSIIAVASKSEFFRNPQGKLIHILLWFIRRRLFEKWVTSSSVVSSALLFALVGLYHFHSLYHNFSEISRSRNKHEFSLLMFYWEFLVKYLMN